MATSDLRLRALAVWARLKARPTRFPVSGRAREPFARRALAVVAKFLLLAVLPFFVLVRVSVSFYSHERYPWFLALAVGVACMLALMTAYGAWLSHRLTGRARALVIARRVALPLVLAYVVYALVYVSGVNAKSERVRAYYTTLHPLLRVALSTCILFDRDVVITDAARRPGDYAGMGLPAKDGSLHARQRDGYVHAADLRTIDRSAVKNRLVQLYFWSMEFGTLRHVGTADHLHVELPVP